MDSLEEFDLVRELNFRSSRRFLSLAEEDLASLVLRARRGTSDSNEDTRFLLTFPPLQPRFAQLLHALLVRFDLTFVVQGWGDERRLIAEATRDKGLLPVVRCEDFVLGKEAPARLADVAVPCDVEDPVDADADAVKRKADEDHDVQQHDDRQEAAPATPVKRKRLGYGGGGMRGWSSDEEESDDEIARKASAGKGRTLGVRAAVNPERVTRGRGFVAEVAAPPSKVEDVVVRCKLRNDYEPYAIDPEDTWRPHRKPYVELLESWEFSHAWSFEPEHNPKKPPISGDPGGIATWRVEHAPHRHFAVALGGQSHEMRRWLLGREGYGEEPYVLEFRTVEAEQQQWEFRFSRCLKLADAKWRPLPWSNERHTIFWMACFIGQEDGKRYLHAGLDNFPEKRFFSARLASFPKAVGFGLSDSDSKAGQSFFIRDIVFFGRGALRGIPFAGRDHIVEAQLPRRKVEALLRKFGQDVKVVLSVGSAENGEEDEEKENLPSKTPWRTMFSDGILEAAPQTTEQDSATPSLVICSSPEQAAEVVKILGSAKAVLGICKTWPIGNDLSGPEAAKQLLEIQAEEWRSLHPEVIRELGFFKEHLERNTRHLEGTRIARSAAMRPF